MKKELALAAAVSLAALIGIAATTEAQGAEARCGMTIRGKVKLTQDLDCTGQPPINLVGPRAHLDLNGHYIICGADGASINMRGRGTLVRNGLLWDCTLKLLEQGDHKVRNVRFDNLEPTAILIRSNSNEVVYSHVSNQNLRLPPRPAVVVESGVYNLIADTVISNDLTALSVGANRTIVINNRLAAQNGESADALEVLGNFNRIFGNEFQSGCLTVSATAIENEIEANDHWQTCN